MRLIVELSGGVLQAVYADGKERIAVSVLDYDNLEALEDASDENGELTRYRAIEKRRNRGITSGDYRRVY